VDLTIPFRLVVALTFACHYRRDHPHALAILIQFAIHRRVPFPAVAVEFLGVHPGCVL
jgi:hypothetical protein